MWPNPCEMKWCYYIPSSIKPKFNKNKRPQLKFISFRSWFFHYNFSCTLGLVLFLNFSYMLLGNHQSLIHIMLNWTGARWISEEHQWRHQLDSNDSLSSFTKRLYVLLVVLPQLTLLCPIHKVWENLWILAKLQNMMFTLFP